MLYIINKQSNHVIDNKKQSKKRQKKEKRNDRGTNGTKENQLQNDSLNSTVWIITLNVNYVSTKIVNSAQLCLAFLIPVQ